MNSSTPEERAEQYANEQWGAPPNYDAHETFAAKDFLAGYRNRDAEVQALRYALADLLTRYVSMASCEGYNTDADPCVQAARAALSGQQEQA